HVNEVIARQRERLRALGKVKTNHLHLPGSCSGRRIHVYYLDIVQMVPAFHRDWNTPGRNRVVTGSWVESWHELPLHRHWYSAALLSIRDFNVNVSGVHDFLVEFPRVVWLAVGVDQYQIEVIHKPGGSERSIGVSEGEVVPR